MFKFFKSLGAEASELSNFTHNYHQLTQLIIQYSHLIDINDYNYTDAKNDVQIFAYYVRLLLVDKFDELDLEPDQKIFISKGSYQQLTVDEAFRKIADILFQLAGRIDLKDKTKDILNREPIFHQISSTIDPNTYQSLDLKI